MQIGSEFVKKKGGESPSFNSMFDRH